MAPQFPGDTLAVMVVYNRRIEACETFLSLAGCLTAESEKMDMLVYDNSPLPQAVPAAGRLSCFRLHYVNDPSNPGVSKAYNKGFELARQLGKKALLLLDQDTLFPEDTYLRYARAIQAYPQSVLFAPILTTGGKIFSPCRNVLRMNFPLTSTLGGKVSVRGKSLLNSGMWIRLEAFERIGGFNEAIPLDFADHDFMRRYRQYFDTFVVVDVACRHGFSDQETIDLNKACRRFGFYCKGARSSARSLTDTLLLFFVVSLRAARLSARYGTTQFLGLLLRTFLQH